MTKRILSLLLVMLLLVPTLALAEATGKEGYLTPTDDPVTLTAMKYAHGLEKVASFAELRDMQYIAEVTNVILDVELITTEEKVSLAINTDSMPDVFLGIGHATYWDKYGAQGSVLALNDLIEENSPYIVELFEERPDAKTIVTAIDGNIYTLPYYVNSGNSLAYNDLMINNAWLEKAGLPQPATVDEFTEALRYFRDNDMDGDGNAANEIPFAPVNGGVWEYSMLSWFGVIKSGVAGGLFSLTEDYNIQLTVETDAYRAYVEYLAMLYAEGLLDPEVYTKSQEQVNSEFVNEQIGACFYNSQTPLHVDDWAFLAPLTSDMQATPIAHGTDAMSAGGWALSYNNVDPVTSMKYVDMFYRDYDETWYGISGLTSNMGIEGIDYVIDENLQSSQLYLDEVAEGYTPWTHFLGYIGMGGIGISKYDISMLKPALDLTTDAGRYSQARREGLARDNELADPMRVISNGLRFTDEAQSRLSVLLTDIGAIMNEQVARFVTGQDPLDDASWDAFLTSLNNVGLQEAFEIVKAAYEA